MFPLLVINNEAWYQCTERGITVAHVSPTRVFIIPPPFVFSSRATNDGNCIPCFPLGTCLIKAHRIPCTSLIPSISKLEQLGRHLSVTSCTIVSLNSFSSIYIIELNRTDTNLNRVPRLSHQHPCQTSRHCVSHPHHVHFLPIFDR